MRGRTFSVYPCPLHCHYNTHSQPFNGLLSGTTRVGRYQKKHSPTHTHPDDRTSFIIFLHLQRSTASLFSLRAWQSSLTTSLQVLSGSTLNLTLHASLHPIIVIPSQHMPTPTQPALLQHQCHVTHTQSPSQLPTPGVYPLTQRHTSTWPPSSHSITTGKTILPTALFQHATQIRCLM